MSKRNRGRLLPSGRQLPSLSIGGKNPFGSRFSPSGSSAPDFISDVSDHLWRSAAVTTSAANTRTDFGDLTRDYRQIITRVSGKLEEKFMKEPRMIQGAPRISERTKNAAQGSRKPLPVNMRERMNGLALNAPDIEMLPAGPPGTRPTSSRQAPSPQPSPSIVAQQTYPGRRPPSPPSPPRILKATVQSQSQHQLRAQPQTQLSRSPPLPSQTQSRPHSQLQPPQLLLSQPQSSPTTPPQAPVQPSPQPQVSPPTPPEPEISPSPPQPLVSPPPPPPPQPLVSPPTQPQHQPRILSQAQLPLPSLEPQSEAEAQPLVAPQFPPTHQPPSPPSPQKPTRPRSSHRLSSAPSVQGVSHHPHAGRRATSPPPPAKNTRRQPPLPRQPPPPVPQLSHPPPTAPPTARQSRGRQLSNS